MGSYLPISALSSESSERDLVSSLPWLLGAWSLSSGLNTSLVDTSVFLTSGSDTSAFSVFVVVGSNPVDSWVSSDGLVEGINKDDFVEFEGSVLTNPVRVEDSKVWASLTDSLLSNSSVGSGWLELVNSLVDWLTVDNTLWDGSLSASSSDSNSVDHVTLLSLVTELSGLIESAWSVDFVDDWELSVLPWSHSHDESENIWLLLSPQLFKIFVSSHLTDYII